MKITVNNGGLVQLNEVYLPIVLESNDYETISICMRDSGFEFVYNGEAWFAKNGVVALFRPNSSPSEQHEELNSQDHESGI